MADLLPQHVMKLITPSRWQQACHCRSAPATLSSAQQSCPTGSGGRAWGSVLVPSVRSALRARRLVRGRPANPRPYGLDGFISGCAPPALPDLAATSRPARSPSTLKTLRAGQPQSWFPPARRLPPGLGGFFVAGGLLPGRAAFAGVPPAPALPIMVDTARTAFMCSTRLATASSARTRSTCAHAGHIPGCMKIWISMRGSIDNPDR